MTLNELFEVLGGPAKVARLIGVTSEAGAGMRTRKSIPVKYWPKLLATPEARAAGITSATMMAAHGRQAELDPKEPDMRNAEEEVARALCRSKGVDPDRPAWTVFLREAQAAIASLK